MAAEFILITGTAYMTSFEIVTDVFGSPKVIFGAAQDMDLFQHISPCGINFMQL
jgi:hypothetical protein